MKRTKKNLLITSALVSVCGCFALVACGDDVALNKSTALGTPSNVNVSVNTLSWNAVSGATNGYTVKINSDESTTVKTTSLDLTTVVTLLSEGENSLQVKANAAGGKKASAYSAAVTYTYHAEQSEKTPFEKVTITLNADTVTWGAVTGATNGYTVKVNSKTADVTTNEVNLLTNTAVNDLLIANSDNSISVMVKAAGDRTDSEYSNSVTYKYVVSADKAAKDFIAAVNAIGTVTLDKADAIDLAKTKYAAIKDDEEALAVDGVSAALATLKQKDCQYFAGLVSGIKAVKEDDEVSAFTTFETKYAEALEYYNGLLDNTAALGAKTALDAAKSKYDNLVAEIKDGVDDLAGDIDALLAVDYTEKVPAKQDLTDLDDKAVAITALKPYAAAYWAEEYAEKTSAIADKKAEILSIAIAEKTVKVQSQVVYNHQNQDATTPTSYIYVIRKFVNVMGDAITEIELPTVTATGATVTAPTAANANGEYVWKLAFDTPVAEETANITYTVEGEEAIPVNIECIRDMSIYSVEISGNLKFQRGDIGHSYMDVYDSSVITKGTVGGEKDIIIGGAPIISGYKVDSDKLTEDSLKSLLARAGLRGEQKVTLVLYNKTEADVTVGEEGEEETIHVIKYSATNETGTLTYTCTLTDDDVLVRIPFTVVNGALEIRTDGSFICGSDFDTAAIVATFNDETVTADNVRNLLRYHVTIYKDGEKKGDFYAPIPGDATLDAAVIRRNVYRFCGETTVDDNISLTVAITLTDESEYADRLRESLTSPQKEWKFNGTGFTATAEDSRFSGGTLNNVAIGATEADNTGDIAYGDWQWAKHESDATYENYFHAYHDGLAILVFDATGMENADTYDFVANNVKPFAVYVHTTFNNASWSAVNAEIDKVWAKLPAADKKDEMKFVFATQVIANEDGKTMGFLDSVPHYFVNNTDSDKHAVVTYNRDFSVPTNNQLIVNNFILPMQENTTGRGELLYNETYGVKYIEVKITITINGKDYYSYYSASAYIMLDDGYYEGFEGQAERRLMGMYISTDKKGERLNLDYASNGWCNYSDFVNFVNANKEYFGLAGEGEDGADLVFTDTDAVEFRTRIEHDGTYFNNESEFSDPVGKNLPADND